MAKMEASLIIDNIKADAIVAILSKEFDRTLESLKKRRQLLLYTVGG